MTRTNAIFDFSSEGLTLQGMTPQKVAALLLALSDQSAQSRERALRHSFNGASLLAEQANSTADALSDMYRALRVAYFGESD